jgi:hypothetical protein
MNLRTLPLLLAAALALPASEPSRIENRTEPLPMGSKLWIVQKDGRVDVEGWDRPEVQLVAEFRKDSTGREPTLEVTHVPEGLRIEVRRPGNDRFIVLGWYREAVCNLTLKVPRKLSTDIRAVDGGIGVQDIEGYAGCYTVDGNIHVASIRGEVHARAVDGSITARDLKARMQAETVDGSITLDLVEGGLKLATVDGAITARDLDGWGEGIAVKTVDGHIHVHLGQAKGNVEASSVDGPITNRAANLVLEGKPNHKRGSIPGRDQTIRLTSVDGAIDFD